jgi:hypothetical protein
MASLSSGTPDLTAESAIPASAKRMNAGCMNWILPPISVASEPDQQAGTWLIEAKLNEDILDWESARLDFQSSEIAAEIVESTMSGADRFTVRTRGKSPLQKHDVIHVGIRMEREG